MPALLLTEAEIAFQLTVADLDLPALPGPEDESSGGQRQRPDAVFQDSIDEIGHGLTMFVPPMLGIGLAAHNQQKERSVGGTVSDKRTLNARL